MTLFASALISGISIGLLYALLAFVIVFLHKTTGVANFAQGNISTLTVFLVFAFIRNLNFGLLLAVLIGIPLSAAVGAAAYGLGLRINDDAGRLNLTIRTLAIYLLVAALIDRFWGIGQPFTFPSLLPRSALHPWGVTITVAALITIGLTLGLVVVFSVFLNRTKTGLMLRAMADDADAATLLGVPTRRLTTVAWAISGVLSLVVGLLVAPDASLTTNLMQVFLLFAFTAAVVGGLNSLPGTLVGGIAVGVVDNIASVYSSSDVAVLAVFLLLVITLLLRPAGIFGRLATVRL